MTEAIRVRFYDVRVRLLTRNLAFATCWIRTDIEVFFTPQPFGSDSRVCATIRPTADGWKYLSYRERFQSPTLYLQRLIDNNVSPD